MRSVLQLGSSSWNLSTGHRFAGTLDSIYIPPIQAVIIFFQKNFLGFLPFRNCFIENNF
jgi:hypothetical protein